MARDENHAAVAIPPPVRPAVQPAQPAGDDKTDELLGSAQLYLRQNQLVAAARCYLEIMRRQPDCFEACWRLGLLLNQFNQLDQSLQCLRAAARIAPGSPKINLVLGAVLKRLNRFEEAAVCCQREIEIDPANADAHYNLGLVLQNLGRLEEAAGAYRRALELRPGYVDALVNLGCLLREQSQPEAALGCFEQALRQEPQNPEPHWELCTTLLSLGRFERGWKEYEWRWKLKDFTSRPEKFPQPLWDGSDLGGRRILLHGEQGFGDIIQFARYATLVARRHGDVILACPQPLRCLLETIPGVRQVVTSRAALPQFDVHAPLLSLPAIFGTSLQTVPAEIPYLFPAPNSFRLERGANRTLNVGIVWAGDPAHRNDRNRSMPLDLFQPLASLPGIRWHSLQAGERAAELARLEPAHRPIDLGSRFRDFADTAQAIQQLDLVISVDTAVAHLTGALGKPIWTLLPFAAEWRWMLEREDTPWYPAMRLFRQASPGDWKGLLARVSGELSRLSLR
jgi:tetratricopeptide (TPR) repeat protein